MSQWSIPIVSREKYGKIFKLNDKNKSGFLSGSQARAILIQSGLTNDILSRIWNLSDVDDDGFLSNDEFILAMHLIDQVKNGNMLPLKLTPDLMPPSKYTIASISTPTAAVVSETFVTDQMFSTDSINQIVHSKSNNSNDSTTNNLIEDESGASKSRLRSKRHANISKDEREARCKEGRLTRYAVRPGYCQSTDRINLLANHFRLSIPDVVVYMYDLAISPVRKNRESSLYEEIKLDPRLKSKFIAEFGRQIYCTLFKDHKNLFRSGGKTVGCVYDGARTIYACKKLEKIDELTKNKEECKIIIETDGPAFEVKPKFTTKVDLKKINDFARGGKLEETPWDALKAIEIIISYALSLYMIQVNQCFFPRTDTSLAIAKQIGVNKFLATGHSQSCKITEIGATLNVDRVPGIFHVSGPLLSILEKVVGKGIYTQASKFIGNNVLDNAFQHLVGLKAFTNHGFKRSFKLKEFSLISACDQYFTMTNDDGNEVNISVSEYFRTKYNMELKYPNTFCIKSGSTARPVYYPLEVVEISPNQPAKKITVQERCNLIKETSRQKPDDRVKNINKSVRNIQCKENNETYKVFKQFDLDLSKEPVEIEGYLLSHPLMKYGRKDSLQLKFGRWEMKDKMVLEAAPGLHRYDNKYSVKWMVVNLARSFERKASLIEEFIHRLMDRARQMDLHLSRPITPSGSRVEYLDAVNHPYFSNSLQFVLGSVLNSHQVDFIIFIFQDKNDVMYRDIKYFCDIEKGINNQCVSSKSIANMHQQSHSNLMTNLLLQINCKLGGINGLPKKISKLEKILDKHTLVMGADVSHPTSADLLTHSIASITASMDSDHYFYECAIRVSKKYCEIIESMKEMALGLLKSYYDKNKRFPKRIFFFRDGVSESMFDTTLSIEVEGIREACCQVSRSCTPKITVIVAQKRHNTRLFTDETVKKNVPSGTLVDSRITHPRDFDYFLCSHNSYIGTSRPAHYTVILDENNLDADTIYNLTFHLCHTYAPATRSISIPAPIQYAHLSAKRTRHHLLCQRGSLTQLESKSFSHERIKSKMYFI